MSEWKEHRLGDVIMFQRGHDLPRTSMKDGKYPVAGSNGIIGYHSEYTTKGPGVTIGRSGSIGAPNYYESDYWAHNTVLYVKDFKDSDPKFIYYFLSTFDFMQFNAGSAVPTLNRNHIHELNVLIPGTNEQRAIASILSSLDDKIDLLHRQNQTLEALAETLFRQWFVEEADEGWEMGRLADFGPIVCGKTPSKKIDSYFGGNIPFIKIPDMHGKTFVFDTADSLSQEGANSQPAKLIPPKSVCVSCIATVGLVS
ncbi:MAG TPA: restriction endonuclease subunit S, partial [Saprospiraceae bacterium]|nr:restriction endonuclease subunit S [Saprospiraceae bacterium]